MNWSEFFINWSIKVNSSVARDIARVPSERFFLNHIWSKTFNITTNIAKSDWLTFFKTWHITIKTKNIRILVSV